MRRIYRVYKVFPLRKKFSVKLCNLRVKVQKDPGLKSMENISKLTIPRSNTNCAVLNRRLHVANLKNLPCNSILN